MKIFFWIAESAADTATVSPNGVNTLLAGCVSVRFINGKLSVINGLRKLRNPPS